MILLESSLISLPVVVVDDDVDVDVNVNVGVDGVGVVVEMRFDGKLDRVSAIDVENQVDVGISAEISVDVGSAAGLGIPVGPGSGAVVEIEFDGSVDCPIFSKSVVVESEGLTGNLGDTETDDMKLVERLMRDDSERDGVLFVEIDDDDDGEEKIELNPELGTSAGSPATWTESCPGTCR